MAKTRKPPVEEPKRRGRLFWICLLVLIEALVWTILAVAGVPEVVATIVALVGGFAFVAYFNEKIWGEGWREQLKADRDRRPR